MTGESKNLLAIKCVFRPTNIIILLFVKNRIVITFKFWISVFSLLKCVNLDGFFLKVQTITSSNIVKRRFINNQKIRFNYRRWSDVTIPYNKIES